ncbi:DUF2892 domain-containing protein [Alicyclobacillus sp. SO9]|uniref:YgaP family membrane protein n=1 Tax=Alicyclobacillus sp. SO9 TaxID=2665646 RepID=UPI0018E6E3E6|nr:DUF2892 domain-containing protein [Alicyclobacillus sp. SO9]QQE80685.1 DUF2892 domain-containing protein [Alicyclobacillus sp. SO9]
MNPFKPNIGTLDRYLRLSAGLIMFGSGIAGRRSPLSRSLLTGLGAAKIAEGITGWCPLVALTSSLTTSSGQRPNSTDANPSAQKKSVKSDKDDTLFSVDYSDLLHSQQKAAKRQNSTKTGPSTDAASALDKLELQHLDGDASDSVMSSDEDHALASDSSDKSVRSEADTETDL